MTIEQIETFLTVTETQNISQAAKKLFVSQSTVSHRIVSLERELGFSLLLRTRGERFVSLTLKGEEFIEIAKKWKNLWNETSLWKEEEASVKLKVAGVDSVNTSIFSGFYKELIKERNNLSLDVSTHWSKTIYELLESYDIDAGFVLRPLKYPNIAVNPLFKGRSVVVSLEGSAYRDEVHPEELDPSDEIVFSSMPGYEEWHSLWWKGDKKSSSSVDTVSLLLATLDSKKQWSVVPVWVARAFEGRYPIKISELSVESPEYSCYYVYNKRPRLSKSKPLDELYGVLREFLEGDGFQKIIR